MMPRFSIFSRRGAARNPAAEPVAGKSPGLPRASGAWLLLAWDVGGLRAAVAQGDRQGVSILARGQSRKADFAAALAETIDRLRGQLARDGHKLPRRAALAARRMRPAVVDLPLDPDRPRPDAQMRELLRSDMEPALAEFGGLWTIGALLCARGYLSGADRERVAAEEALRRKDRRAPLRYGETGLELSLIDRAALNECLELQESLQYLDSEPMSAWKGRLVDGERCWLAAALAGRQYRQWSDALAARGIELDAVLPLAWLCSEDAGGGESGEDGEKGDHGDIQRLCLELHCEEVVAVRRRRGLIAAARAEGRMERPLQGDWLRRLIEDWSGEARAEIGIVCLDAADEDAARRAAGDIELTSGHPVRVTGADAAWDALWAALLREAAAQNQEHRLPRLKLRELRGKPWKNPDILRVAALLAVALALVATEGVQRYRLHALRQTLAERTKKESDGQKLTQLVSRANAEAQQVARELESSRQALEPLINERARLEAIAAMRQYLPDLMLALGQAIGNDAVLEKVGNSRVVSDATAIRVEAWSPTYTGAQNFVNRVAEQTRALAYGVAQTEIREEHGRAGKSGHRVGFWLVQEPDELEQPQERKPQ
ncbi:MAG: hypothetical protein LBI87_12570 [Candidatus Accumulibacter sp.]|jgi:hypothetical protein|nr:hypothetical protein [Accumulibacter sp.]